MKQMTLLTTLFIFSLIACNNEKKTDKEKTATETKSETSMKPAPDSATAMKNWQEYMTPGEVHKMMSGWDGKWAGEVTMWMAPDAPPTQSTSAAVNKMAMNGLYQISNHSGSFNGMPFEGMSTVAYDNHKKEFESIWIDNMGSGIMHLRGPWDAATKTITLKGKMIDPTSGNEVEVKETFKIVDENTQVMEMFAPGPDGKEFKTMQITYKRSN